ncbi:MAG TPA: hypothetical protein VNK96_06910 [Fimbriimonadales bacterium]|nr:hypothetical protein [Fimbriimonadales bacterium]
MLAFLLSPLILFFPQQSALEIRNLTINPPSQHTLYQPIEIRFELSGTWSNPFDPTQADVTATIIAENDTYSIVNGIFFQEYEAQIQNDEEILKPIGEPTWRIRFAPWRTGSFDIFIKVSDMTRAIEAPKIGIKVARKNAPPFISIPEKSLTFMLEKQTFIPIGVTLNPLGKKGLTDIEERFAQLAEKGFNCCRVILTPENLGLEWTPTSAMPDYRGLGIYNLKNAWRLDRLCEIAQKHKIYLLITLSTGDEWTNRWEQNPYNKKNGGPCNSVDDFWTDVKARVQFKRRLRYQINLLQHHQNILGFQIFDGIEAPAYWLREIGNEIIGIHTFGLPLTTFPESQEARKLKQLGFRSFIIESDKDAIQAGRQIYTQIADANKIARKPTLVFANSLPKEPLALRTFIWSSFLSGAFGGIVIPENEIRNEELLKKAIVPFSSLIRETNWSTRKWESSMSNESEAIIWSIADESGGFAYISTPPDVTTQQVSIRFKHLGNVRCQWINPETGEKIKEETRKSDGSVLRFTAIPPFRDVLCIFSKV